MIRHLLRPFFHGSVQTEPGDLEIGCFAQEVWGGHVGLVESISTPKHKGDQPVAVIAYGKDQRAILPAHVLRRVRTNVGSSFDSRLGKPMP